MDQKVSPYSQPASQNGGPLTPLATALRPFRCRLSSCQADLGLHGSKADAFYVGGLVIVSSVTLICLANHCGHESRWAVHNGTHPARRAELVKLVEAWHATLPAINEVFPTLSHVPCFQCDAVLAYTDGSRLYVGQVVIPHFVKYACLHCGTRSTWRPIIKPCPC